MCIQRVQENLSEYQCWYQNQSDIKNTFSNLSQQINLIVPMPIISDEDDTQLSPQNLNDDLFFDQQQQIQNDNISSKQTNQNQEEPFELLDEGEDDDDLDDQSNSNEGQFLPEKDDEIKKPKNYFNETPPDLKQNDSPNEKHKKRKRRSKKDETTISKNEIDNFNQIKNNEIKDENQNETHHSHHRHHRHHNQDEEQSNNKNIQDNSIDHSKSEKTHRKHRKTQNSKEMD